MVAQVQALEGELLITFLAPRRNHSRRVLVDAIGTYTMEDRRRGVVLMAGNKYFAACDAIWVNRAH